MWSYVLPTKEKGWPTRIRDQTPYIVVQRCSDTISEMTTLVISLTVSLHHCVMIELPYDNASLNRSVGISVDDVDANNSVSSPEEADPFCLAGGISSSSMVFSHLNVQSLHPKMDE